METAEKVKKTVKRLLKEREMTQGKLAKKTGISSQYLSLLLKEGGPKSRDSEMKFGHRTLTLDLIDKIAGALNISAIELIEEEDKVSTRSHSEDKSREEVSKLQKQIEEMTLKMENYAVLVRSYEKTVFDLIANDLEIKAHFTYEDENGKEVAEKFTSESDEVIKSARAAGRRVILGVYEEEELRQIITAALNQPAYKSRGLGLTSLAPELLHPMWRRVAISLSDNYLSNE
ncbi:MAG: helix-turn-helix transcriptional regulator [Cytophagaceae bacterium]|nr:helix-turn-helix transcriptional regulator [Cytophagaceae bacterium]